ncbi:MAG: chloride channel protein [Bacteroidales bacterium]|nr:chloride channel protein [Candidatus Equimonas faecalis]
MSPIVKWSKEHLSKQQQMWVLSFVVGIGSALAAQGLKWLIGTVERIVTSGHDITQANWVYLVAPVVGIWLSMLFIRYVVRDDIGHGVTKILYAISRKQGLIRAHNMWSSVVASGLTIGFGGSVGAESPIVLTGSAIGSNVGRSFRMDHRTLMVLVGCGASAAIAGIFKAPIAGVMFTLEVLMIDLTMASLVPLLVSSLTATCITYILTGDEALFAFTRMDAFDVERVPLVLLLGLCCGLLSLYFTRAMNRFEKVFSRFSNRYIRLSLGGVVLALLIYLFPSLYGEGYTTINVILASTGEQDVSAVLNNSLFYGQYSFLLPYFGLILLLKVFATTATNGGGGCGGTFAPSLFLGCICGFVFASLWNMWAPFGVVSPLTNFALYGMAGVMAGVFHAPLTGVFLIAELTGGYEFFLPLLIVSLTSYVTAHAFEPHSIYAMRLARAGELLTHHKDQAVITLMKLDDVVDTTRPTFRLDMTLGEIVRVLASHSGNYFAVVDAGGMLRGIVHTTSIRRLIFRTELYRVYTARQLMEPVINGRTIYTTDTMATIMDKCEHAHVNTLPVITPEKEFRGFVTKTRILSYYRQIMQDFSEE